jgi:hypothetical protein
MGGALRAERVTAAKLHRLFDRGAAGTEIKLSAVYLPSIPVCPASWKAMAIVNPQARDEAWDEIKARNPRKKNLYSGKARCLGEAFQEREVPIDYKGAFKGWRGSEIYADYQSAVFFTRSGRAARLVVGCVLGRLLRAPAGMLWSRDENGVKLVRQSDGMDYHPTLEDFQARDFATRARHGMAENYRLRAETRKAEAQAARENAIYEREVGSVRVNIHDSRRAGNCVAGSIAFAERKLGVDRETIVAAPHLVSFTAEQLRRVSGSEKSRVEAAIRQAWMRETTVSI